MKPYQLSLNLKTYTSQVRKKKEIKEILKTKEEKTIINIVKNRQKKQRKKNE